eukprot:gene9453-10444_t
MQPAGSRSEKKRQQRVVLARGLVSLCGDIHSQLHPSIFNKPKQVLLQSYWVSYDGPSQPALSDEREQEIFELVAGRLRIVLNSCLDLQPKPHSLVATSPPPPPRTLALTTREGKALLLLCATEEDFSVFQEALGAMVADLICLQAVVPNESGRIPLLPLQQAISAAALLTKSQPMPPLEEKTEKGERKAITMLQRVRGIAQVRQRVAQVLQTLLTSPHTVSLSEIESILEAAAKEKLLNGDPDLVFLSRLLKEGPRLASDWDWQLLAKELAYEPSCEEMEAAVIAEGTACVDAVSEPLAPLLATVRLASTPERVAAGTSQEIESSREPIQTAEEITSVASNHHSNSVVPSAPGASRLQVVSFAGGLQGAVRRLDRSPGPSETSFGKASTETVAIDGENRTGDRLYQDQNEVNQLASSSDASAAKGSREQTPVPFPLLLSEEAQRRPFRELPLATPTKPRLASRGPRRLTIVEEEGQKELDGELDSSPSLALTMEISPHGGEAFEPRQLLSEDQVELKDEKGEEADFARLIEEMADELVSSEDPIAELHLALSEDNESLAVEKENDQPDGLKHIQVVEADADDAAADDDGKEEEPDITLPLPPASSSPPQCSGDDLPHPVRSTAQLIASSTATESSPINVSTPPLPPTLPLSRMGEALDPDSSSSVPRTATHNRASKRRVREGYLLLSLLPLAAIVSLALYWQLSPSLINLPQCQQVNLDWILERPMDHSFADLIDPLGGGGVREVEDLGFLEEPGTAAVMVQVSTSANQRHSSSTLSVAHPIRRLLQLLTAPLRLVKAALSTPLRWFMQKISRSHSRPASK